jgi:hypothetical protein
MIDTVACVEECILVVYIFITIHPVKNYPNDQFVRLSYRRSLPLRFFYIPQ